jgi:outer membrane receptor for Fe3+-dicitrate
VQDATNPFASVQTGPSGRTDSRHRITVSAVIEAPGGINISPIFRYRSALPVNISYGYDDNQNGANNDIYTEAYAFAGLDSNNNPTFKDLGLCATINCGRGTGLSVFNLRVSRVFSLGGRAHLEAIAEVFNLFNALNPGGFIGSYFVGSKSSHSLNPNFLRPDSFAGDFQMPEQRVGQIGFRLTF